MLLLRSVGLPRVEPIVPTSRPAPFNDPGWLFEPKYDGLRGMAYLTRGRHCTIYSKRGNRFRGFEELRQRICAELPKTEAILDGEVVAIDEAGRVDFGGLMKGRGHLAYAAFDVLWLNGRDLRPLPLAQRKKRLDRLVPLTTDTLLLVSSLEENGCELFEAACWVDIEGIVAKRKADPYTPRTTWYTVNNPTYSQARDRQELFGRRQDEHSSSR